MRLILLSLSFFAILSVNAQNISWAKSAQGTQLDEGTGIAVDGNGNTYITGLFESETLTFGSKTLTNTLETKEDIFVAKFDINGDCIWAKSFGGPGNEAGNKIVLDQTNNVLYVVGYMYGSFNFGGTPLTLIGYKDVVLLKMDLDGNPIAGKNFGSNSDTNGKDICLDQNGNVFITGFFFGTSIDFGTGSLMNAGFVNAFVAKFDPSLTNLWAQRIGGSENDRGFGIDSDEDGAVYVTGSFNSPSISLGANTITNNDSRDNIFVAKYSETGSNLWANSIESPNGSAAGNSVNVMVEEMFMLQVILKEIQLP